MNKINEFNEDCKFVNLPLSIVCDMAELMTEREFNNIINAYYKYVLYDIETEFKKNTQKVYWRKIKDFGDGFKRRFSKNHKKITTVNVTKTTKKCANFDDFDEPF